MCGDSKTEWKRKVMGLPVPDRPEHDPVVEEIEHCYFTIARMRRVCEGGELPLSLIEIEQYLNRYPNGIDPVEFDASIYAMDEVYLKHWRDQRNSKKEE